jgi:hypothetical protein
LFDTIGINHCKIFKISAYFKNQIGIIHLYIDGFWLLAVAGLMNSNAITQNNKNLAGLCGIC